MLERHELIGGKWENSELSRISSIMGHMSVKAAPINQMCSGVSSGNTFVQHRR